MLTTLIMISCLLNDIKDNFCDVTNFDQNCRLIIWKPQIAVISEFLSDEFECFHTVYLDKDMPQW